MSSKPGLYNDTLFQKQNKEAGSPRVYKAPDLPDYSCAKVKPVKKGCGVDWSLDSWLQRLA